MSERAYAAMIRGALDEAALVVSQPARTAIDHAWSLALRAAGALLDPDAFEAPSVDEIARHRTTPLDARAIAALACAHLARRAVLGFARRELDAITSLHAALAHDLPDASEPRLWLALGHAWSAWLRGDLEDDDASLATIERLAREAGSAPVVIDAGTLRALRAESRGDVTSMLAHARRASRMARTEALPAHEHLAHLVLARARRSARHPHLALRILGALDRFVAEPCRPWVRWERLLAGDTEALEGLRPAPDATCAERGAAALASVLRAATAGDEPALERAAHALFDAVGPIAFAAREARHVLVALDARVDARAEEPELAAWCSGATIAAPASIHGLCMRIDAESRDAAEAIVLAAPDAAPRRVLGAAGALVARHPRVHLRKTLRRRGRVETLVAVLACAGPEGLTDPECFARTYEMPYDAIAHRGVFEVLVTRARLYLEGAGEIVRGQGVIALRLRAAIAVPDPRCAAPIHDAVLRVLAHDGRVTASDAAKRVGLSLRAVQQALRSLAEDGVCVGEKEGRQIVYAVEDTTFSEPTYLLARRS
ncbi:winged helix-turn-helix domain-containing protein [Sandaracinus amylolyticus]|uniref:Uncharacterized protein n=1 Tax=Sandaracinus amylolyticus TaxID=927083 RepID=A0A0F6YM16_9BACT|nr:winged helix-turn-helix domain-containing protein [Sandaracinus amylolyticus]AKF10845.1 hypothetical protein DB32_007994 [Sandaracinus amylolyticus]